MNDRAPSFSAAVLLLVAVLAGTSGCRRDSPAGPAGPLLVAVSITPEAWLAQQVGGPHVEVIALVTPGDSPHTYQPSDAQVSRLMGAAVYFRIGAPFEKGPWFQAIQASRKLTIVDLRQGLPLREMAEHDHHDDAGGKAQPMPPGQHAADECTADGKDPHIWLSPRLLRIQAATMARSLSGLDPAHADEYQRNLAAVQSRLDDLDAQIRVRLQTLAGKAFFVFHPAWGYFAHDYGLRQIAIEVEGKQPSDRELSDLQRQARQMHVKVVFVQPQIFGRAVNAVADATGARVETADPLAADLPAELLHFADTLATAQGN